MVWLGIHVATASRGDLPFKASILLSCSLGVEEDQIWEFPKIRDTLFWGPYTKGPTI